MLNWWDNPPRPMLLVCANCGANYEATYLPARVICQACRFVDDYEQMLKSDLWLARLETEMRVTEAEWKVRP